MIEKYRLSLIPLALLVLATLGGPASASPTAPAEMADDAEGRGAYLEEVHDGDRLANADIRTDPEPEILTNRVAADSQHSCMIDDQGQAYCWGRAGYGRLGQGKAVGQNLATPQIVRQGELRFAAITAGLSHTCALTDTGEAYCWGLGSQGRMGNGKAGGNNSTPQAVSGGHRFIQITAGRRFTCALTTDRDAYCWGANENNYSPLGIGDASSLDRSIPVAVLGAHKFAWISAAKYHACGVTTAGDAYCWGSGGAGRLGNGASTGAYEPVLVSGGHRFVRINGGNNHTCALTEEGEAWCWGSNGNGKRGTLDENGNLAKTSDVPVKISSDLKFRDLQLGSHHSCGISTDGKTYCWGSQTRGKLGNGKTAAGNVPAPTEVRGSHDFVELGIGIDHSCALTAAGDTYCWGRGNNGQIGNGAVKNVGTPTRVDFTAL